MTIDIKLNAEQESAVLHHAKQNGAVGLKPEECMTEWVTYNIKQWVEQAYNDSVQRLGSAARSMPYEARTALIDQVESMLK